MPADPLASLRLGVVWYRTLEEEAHNADGKHIAYLRPAIARRRARASWTRTCISAWPAW